MQQVGFRWAPQGELVGRGDGGQETVGRGDRGQKRRWAGEGGQRRWWAEETVGRKAERSRWEGSSNQVEGACYLRGEDVLHPRKNQPGARGKPGLSGPNPVKAGPCVFPCIVPSLEPTRQQAARIDEFIISLAAPSLRLDEQPCNDHLA